MNILFHTTSAMGISLILADSNSAKPGTKASIAVCAFVFGIVTHGVLDYMPHCYPVPPKWDAIFGLFMIAISLKLTPPMHRLMVAGAMLGSVFPDLIDLSPAIVNKYLDIGLPVYGKVFPWHWPEYSGSIFTDDCQVSTFNHVCVVGSVLLLILIKGIRK